MIEIYKLNVGCGEDIRKDCINLDIVDLPGVDVVADLEKPLPFEKDVFEEIYCYNVLEHVDNLFGLMDELHRISKKNAKLFIKVPHFSFFTSYIDPTHKRFFGFQTFDYFTEFGDFNFYSQVRYKIIKREMSFLWFNDKKRRVESRALTFLINLWPKFYERFFCWIFPVNEIFLILEPFKK